MNRLMPFVFGLIVTATLCGCMNSDSEMKVIHGGLRAIVGSSNEPGALFEKYDPQGFAKRKSNWTAPFNLTGVSWNDSRTCTLITRQHVVMAAHYTRPSDVPVIFHDRKGRNHERFIVGVKSLAPQYDVAIGKLDQPLPDLVKYYEFPPIRDVAHGVDVLVTDQTKQVSIHQVSAKQGAMIQFSYHPTLPESLRRNLVTGDSGNPTFVISGGDLKLVETHTYGGPGTGPDYSQPQLQKAIHAAIRGW